MKKTILLLVFLAIIKISSAQWTAIDSFAVQSVCLVQPNDGWAFGSDFRHWDGASWYTALRDTSFWASVSCFTSPGDGWVFGWQDSVYRYDGTSWTKHYTGHPSIWSCDFFDSQNGWACKISNYVYRYQNGTWTTTPLNLPASSSGYYIAGIKATGTSTAWMGVTKSSSTPWPDTSYMLQFHNGQWVMDTCLAGFVIRNIDFTDQNHGWVLGYDDTWMTYLLKYNGSNWVVDATLGPYRDGGAVCMYNNSLGWAAVGIIDDYYIYGYNGFGWYLQDTLHWPVTQLSFADPLNGFALAINNSHIQNPPNKLFLTTSGGLGVENASGAPDFTLNIFPNPARDKIMVEFWQQPKADLRVFGLSGELLLRREAMPGCTEVDIRGLPAGMYLLEVNSLRGTTQTRFIKE